jgi:ubiquitin-conjugating enzyme (huntingtin interacting protein 2)
MQYLKDYQTFVSTARYWTESFAKTSSRGIEDKVTSLWHLCFGTWMHIIKHSVTFL